MFFLGVGHVSDVRGRSRYIFPGTGAAGTFYLKPELEPKPE